ncbi:hypothetical protein VTN00DRAFT_2836 [Thermoascus crustaceus]|uniref:uncharacterized protein n=1 Tax=Thermoascus crustaceus TaxID=5088 RepID=UPI0037437472
MPPQDAQDEEEDYMSMTIVEPQAKETFAQRKLRQQRECRQKPEPSTLDPSNKGFKMMAKLGFKPGDALGKQPSPSASTDGAGSSTATTNDWGRSRTEPLNIVIKEDRGGIGLDSEKKRKFREEAEQVAKKAKAEEGDYRERLRLEREERRTEAQVHAAQKVAERLDTEAEAETAAEAPGRDTDIDKREPATGEEDREEKPSPEPGPSKPKSKIKLTSQINVLYRGLVREREERERSILARHALQTSIPSSFVPNPKLPGYEDATLDPDDKHALGISRDASTIVEQELEEDPELDEFNALEPKERLRRLVMYLREKHRYCFWCKYRYETDEMEGCPGVTEEDHD